MDSRRYTRNKLNVAFNLFRAQKYFRQKEILIFRLLSFEWPYDSQNYRADSHIRFSSNYLKLYLLHLYPMPLHYWLETHEPAKNKIKKKFTINRELNISKLVFPLGLLPCPRILQAGNLESSPPRCLWSQFP
ncbi:hypothetical protein Drorol1_Dr00024904 [Drosera rotundifolia]